MQGAVVGSEVMSFSSEEELLKARQRICPDPLPHLN